MKTIESFKVNHNILQKGMYISRIDGDVVTYDIRMKRPNNPENDYLENASMHTFEHLFATYARNSKYSEDIVYVGPMGCRTGFYFLVRNLSQEQALELIKDTVKKCAEHAGEIPGTTAIECGNYKEHDKIGAKNALEEYYSLLKDYNVDNLQYN